MKILILPNSILSYNSILFLSYNSILVRLYLLEEDNLAVVDLADGLEKIRLIEYLAGVLVEE